MNTEWSQHVFPHGPLTQIAPRLWSVTGHLKRGKLTRNMAVYKLVDGGLLIDSAIALNDAGMKSLEALGKPKILVVPNPMHRLDAKVYKQRYPEITVVCPNAAQAKANEVVHVDGNVEDLLPPLGIKVHTIDGLKPFELCYEVPLDQGTALLFTDALMNLPNLPGVDGFLMRVLGSTGFFGITRIGRLLLLKDKAAFRKWLLARADETQVRAIVVAHGAAITSEATSRLREAAART